MIRSSAPRVDRSAEPQPQRDPAFPVVVRRLERHPKYWQGAQNCPDLADPRTPVAHAFSVCNVVLVHGGLSNCLADYGDDLIGGPTPLLGGDSRVRVYRFEHDTWLPIQANVIRLAHLVRQKLHGQALLFVGVSRGGIVATRAAARLWESGALGHEAAHRRGPPGIHRDVAVMTFGSPHLGFATSNIAALLPRLGYCAQYMVSSATLSLPARLRRAVFFRTLNRLHRLPPGIADLSPANPEFEQFMRSRAGRWVEQRLLTFGGTPPHSSSLPAWCRPLMARPIPGQGDGAVAIDSAIAWGASRKALAGCSHNDYFKHGEVREAIANQIGHLCER